MGTQLNEQTYQKLINEDIQALEKYMPKYSLEKKHAIDVLKWSVKQIYHSGEAEGSDESGGLHLHNVTNSGEYQKRFCGKCVETTKHKIAMHKYNGAIGEVWKCTVCDTNNAWAS